MAYVSIVISYPGTPPSAPFFAGQIIAGFLDRSGKYAQIMIYDFEDDDGIDFEDLLEQCPFFDGRKHCRLS